MTAAATSSHGVVGILCEQNRFLVIRRSAFVKAPDRICFPGGHIEEGESFEEAVRREWKEELNLDIAIIGQLWSNVTAWGTRLEWFHIRRPTNTEPIPNPREVAEVLWLTASEIVQRTDLLTSMTDFFAALHQGEIRLFPENSGIA